MPSSGLGVVRVPPGPGVPVSHSSMTFLQLALLYPASRFTSVLFEPTHFRAIVPKPASLPPTVNVTKVMLLFGAHPAASPPGSVSHRSWGGRVTHRGALPSMSSLN